MSRKQRSGNDCLDRRQGSSRITISNICPEAHRGSNECQCLSCDIKGETTRSSDILLRNTTSGRQWSGKICHGKKVEEAVESSAPGRPYLNPLPLFLRPVSLSLSLLPPPSPCPHNTTSKEELRVESRVLPSLSHGKRLAVSSCSLSMHLPHSRLSSPSFNSRVTPTRVHTFHESANSAPRFTDPLLRSSLRKTNKKPPKH